MNNILVTGGSGLVGKALREIMPHATYVSSGDYDLTNENEVIAMYESIRPYGVIHLAARVGGIFDNINHPADYFDSNILMNTLMIKYAHAYNVERFLGILSSCIFPDKVDLSMYPMKEDALHNGPPAATNFTYGIAKRATAVQIESYNIQYKTKYNYISPCNLYGTSEKDDEEKSHFVTALIKKIFQANKSGADSIILYGDGTPLRQFMYVDDIAKIIKIIVDNDITESFNVVSDENISIDEIARIALRVTNSEHLKIIYDRSKPNGQMRKDLDNSKLKKLIPNFVFTRLEDGIKKYYENYTNEKNNSYHLNS
jgi:GDP-L-fucose synthase